MCRTDLAQAQLQSQEEPIRQSMEKELQQHVTQLEVCPEACVSAKLQRSKPLAVQAAVCCEETYMTCCELYARLTQIS